MKSILKLFLFLPMFVIAEDSMVKENIDSLNEKEKNIVTISAFTAVGDMQRLEPALNAGLDSGLSINEIKESLVHLYAYTGFPRSLNALGLFMKVLDERKAAGKNDIQGKEASPLPKDFDRDAFGAKVRAKLSGLEQDISGAPWQKFSPEIDKFLKEHLFADLFARDVLDYKTRELVTISALAAMSGTAGQLKYHLGAAMNAGLSANQVKDFVKVLDERVDTKQAKIAGDVLASILKD